MKRLVVIALALCLVAALATEASAQRRGGGVYRGGSAAVRGPAGGAAVRGPAGNVAVRGPTNVYGGVYRPVAAGVVVGAAAVGVAAAASYPPAYYAPPCGPPYTPYCP